MFGSKSYNSIPFCFESIYPIHWRAFCFSYYFHRRNDKITMHVGCFFVFYYYFFICFVSISRWRCKRPQRNRSQTVDLSIIGHRIRMNATTTTKSRHENSIKKIWSLVLYTTRLMYHLDELYILLRSEEYLITTSRPPLCFFSSSSSSCFSNQCRHLDFIICSVGIKRWLWNVAELFCYTFYIYCTKYNEHKRFRFLWSFSHRLCAFIPLW